MKKIITLVCIIVFSSIISAQDFSNIKICINPGHGGHDSNDRFIQETGFWESDGNLDKGLFVRDLLEGFNADVIMTRTTNTTADDLPLSQIVEIANSNNVDYFHSIHSNAYDAKSNYTLVLFQGKNTLPTYAGALTMANYVVNEIYQAHRTTSKMVAGDYDFYGTGKPYLGVFKGLNMPGTLSEGSFHDYVPESWRLRNLAYKKHEAWAIVKAFISYFNLTPIQTGMIAGLVRDPEQKVTYYGITSKGDDIKPLNNIKVTLQPGNIVFKGDSLNNGFFLFDSLAPGQYKLIYECDNYFKDSATVNILANSTTFADKYLQYDTTIAPLVVSHYPINSPDSIKTSTLIKVSFNRVMNRSAVESSFSIYPNTKGIFTWEDGDKTVVFTPTIPLDKAANYQVTISTGAKSKWNVSIQNNYSFSFITKNRNRLVLEKNYPSNNQENISTTVQIRLAFDAAVNTGSLANQINLYNSSNTRISVKNAKVFTENGKGFIYFEPANILNPDSNYKIVLGGGIADMDNIPLVEQYEINFKTEPQQNITGTIINDFESLNGFQVNMFGVDTLLTKFELASDRKINGSNSGKISYQFNTNGAGSLMLSNSKTVTVKPSGDIEFGLWLFGDLSNNYFEMNLADNPAYSYNVFADSINWTGWRFINIKLPSFNANGDIMYYSFALNKNMNGTSSGAIYLEDAQFYSSPTDVKNDDMPILYVLNQNYPNPFNPTTNFSYAIARTSLVTLKVYDILGREVAVLVNEEKHAGKYSIEFNAGNLASGVYFYKLKAGEYTATKKLILLK